MNALPLWSIAPFVFLIVAIAVLELVAVDWWARPINKLMVSIAAAVPAAGKLILGYGGSGGEALIHSLADYAAFIALVGALYVIAGGIMLEGSLAGTPLSNMAMLGIGGILANIVGTTGASMIMIRPVLRANV